MSKRFFLAIFSLLVVAYIAVILPYTTYLKNRPTMVKLGYLPEAEIIKTIAGDQRYLVAEYSILNVLLYFGTLIDSKGKYISTQPEFFNMFKMLETGIKLDPYNQDAYYFAQAAFTWEVGRAADVNRLLLYGMRFRTWDYALPFYIGFNSAFFLKDYKNAAMYMKKAAELSGEPLFASLASRFFYEARQSDLGILFLDISIHNAKDPKIRNLFAIRKKALTSIKFLADAVQKFKVRYHKMPSDLNELSACGLITKIPDDPYGGQFYIAEQGMIRSTSELAFGSKE